MNIISSSLSLPRAKEINNEHDGFDKSHADFELNFVSVFIVTIIIHMFFMNI